MSSIPVRYTDLRPHQFRDRLQQRAVAYLPLATLEWHGEHLPLGADGIISEGLMCDCAQKFGGIVMPPIHLGPDRASLQPGGRSLYGMDTADHVTDPQSATRRQLLLGQPGIVPADRRCHSRTTATSRVPWGIRRRPWPLPYFLGGQPGGPGTALWPEAARRHR